MLNPLLAYATTCLRGHVVVPLKHIDPVKGIIKRNNNDCAVYFCTYQTKTLMIADKITY